MRHKMELLELEQAQQRKDADADHAQELRHQQEGQTVAQTAQKAVNEEELRRLGLLKQMGVDLTKYMCVAAQSKPDQHLRIDGADGPQLHLAMK